jgi:hypothetical protein
MSVKKGFALQREKFAGVCREKSKNGGRWSGIFGFF